MQIIQDSAEHHFLTLLEKIKHSPADWEAIHCAFSRGMDHDALIQNPAALSGVLSAMREEGGRTIGLLQDRAQGFENAYLYHFSDNDVMLVARPQGQAMRDAFFTLFKDLSHTTQPGLIDFIKFEREMLAAQKLADRKLLAEKRMASYRALGDVNQLASINIRRQRRDHAIVQVVEDDRFTAAYTTGILSKSYDYVHSRTGEDAIADYIRHAPDIVFMDIHLPGLDGLETLNAIRHADSQAHVVMLSVDTARNNVVTATRYGAAGFLKKPFSKDRILAIVEKSPFVRGSKSIVNRA